MSKKNQERWLQLNLSTTATFWGRGGEGCVLKTKTYDLESDKKVYCSLIEKKYEIRLLSPSTSLYGLKSR